MAAVPVISPDLRVDSDALGHLKDGDRIAVANGFDYRLSCNDSVTKAVDKRDPNNPRVLDSLLVVDQLAFLRALPVRRSIAQRELRVDRVECEYMELNDWSRFVTSFRIRW